MSTFDISQASGPVEASDQVWKAARAVAESVSEDGDWEVVKASDLDVLRSAIAAYDDLIRNMVEAFNAG